MSKVNQLNLLNLILIYVIISISKFVEDFYSPFTIEIVNDLGILKSDMQHASSMYFAGFVFGVIIFGQLSDILGRKACVLMCFVLIGMGTIIFSTSTDIEWFSLGKFIQGMGSCMSSVLSQAICRDVYDEKSLSKVYGHGYYFSFVAGIVAPFLGGQAVSYLSWRESYSIILCILLAFLIINFLYLEETFNGNKLKLFSRNFLRAMKDKFGLCIIMSRNMLFDLNVLLRSIIIGLSGSITFGMISESPFFYMEVLSISPENYSLIYIALGLGLFLMAFVNNFLIKRLDTIALLRVSSVCTFLLGWLFLIVIFFAQKFGLTVLQTASLSCLIQILVICFTTVTSNNILTSTFRTKENIGISSSIFISMYYTVITFMVFLIGTYSPANLFSMPTIVLIFASAVFIILHLGIYTKRIVF